MRKYICLVILLLGTINTFATRYFWNVRSGKWEIPTNWNPNGSPASSNDLDETDISNGGTAIIDNTTGNATIRAIYSCYISISGKTDTLIIDGDQAILEATRTVITGQNSNSNGTLILRNGGRVICAGPFYVGYSNARGKITVGSGSMISGTRVFIGGDQSRSNGIQGILSGSGTIVSSSDVRIWGTGILSAGDTDGAIGTLTITGNLDLQTGSTLQVDLGQSNICDKIIVSDTVKYDSGNALLNITTWKPGTFTVMSATIGLNASKFTIKLNGADLPADKTASLSVSGNNLILTTKTAISSNDITVSPESVTYNGLPQTITLTDNGTPLVLNTDYTVTYTNNTNVGTANAVITGQGKYTGNRTVDFTITPKTLTTTTGTFSKTYDGTKTATPTVAYTLNGIVGSENVMLNATFEYDNANAGTNKPVTATTWELMGTATANYTLAAFPNTVTGEITQAPLSLTFNNDTKTYTGNNIDIAPAQLTGVIGGVTIPITYSYEKDGTTTAHALNAGAYIVTAGVTGDTNHAAASATATLTVNKATPVIQLTSVSTEYTGNPVPVNTPVVTGSTTAGNLPLTIVYEGTNGTSYSPSANAPANCGSYKVTVSTVGDANHHTANSETTLSIGQATPKMNISDASKIYDGTPLPVTATIVPNHLAIIYSYTGTLKDGTAYPATSQAPVDAGDYKVTASTPGDANYSATQVTANITINDAGAPTLVLDNCTVTYNGQPQSIGTASVQPAFAQYLTITYTYSNANYPASTTPPTNAGVYTVTATTPADANFKAGEVTAMLTIDKAPQTIIFNLPATKQLGDAPFNAGASVNTGLPLTYASGNTAIATIDGTGLITILTSGVVTFTVSQPGNENYLPASETRSLSITSNDNTLHGITVDGQPLTVSDNMLYVMPCGSENNTVSIVLTTETNATVSTGKSFTVTVDKPQLKTVSITVTSQDGTQNKTYTLTIERRFPFEQIVKMRWNNTLTVINNPDNNGGYSFTSYKWYRNGQEIGTGQSWSAGKDGETLNPADVYYVEITSSDFTGTLRTYESAVTLRSMLVTAYPNPVSAGQTLYIQADVDDELLRDAVIEVYNATGNRVGLLKVQGQLTLVDIRYFAGIHFFVLKGKDGFTKELKVVVK